MLGYIDWLIIAIAVLAILGAIFLLLPSGSNREAQQLRIIRLQAENDRKRIAEVLEITQHGVQDAESLIKQLHQQLENSTQSIQTAQTQATQSEQILERVSKAEREMHDVSSQLGERLQHLQSYWDEQLGDSVESVKRIRSKLHEGLTQVDDSIQRLREQEKMAQGFTRRLIEHHQQQAKHQQDNARLSDEVQNRLEEMLQESNVLLDQMHRYQKEADTAFQKFTTEIETLENQAQDHMNTLAQNSDLARHELQAGLDESRQHVEIMRHREQQSSDLSRRINQHFEQIDHIRVERIAKTLDLTEQMSSELHKGMENARELLTSLEVAVQDITASLNHTAVQPASVQPNTEMVNIQPANLELPLEEPATPSDDSQPTTSALVSTPPIDDKDTLALLQDLDDTTPHNLVNLRAYR